jgi:hypothetical protein
MALSVKCVETDVDGDNGLEYYLRQVQVCSGVHLASSLMGERVLCFIFLRIKWSECAACSPDEYQNDAINLARKAKKSKSILPIGRGGLQDCEMLRIPYFLDNQLRYGG